MKRFKDFVVETNMSYCRFENTYRDLQDCYNAMDDDLSEEETEFRKRLIELCRDISDEYGHLTESTDSDKLKKLKLISKALKTFPNSPKQLKIRKEIDEIEKKIKKSEK